MNLDLDEAALFLRVAELGSLSAAARERNAPVSQVSRALARLEARLGVRLLHRTTHGLSLTDAGEPFAAHARRLLDTRDELAAALRLKRSGPSGWVRLADDRLSDMARDGIDVAIRTGSPASENLVALPMAEHGRRVVASPTYLRRFGTPLHPDELAQHRLITSSASPLLNRWPWAAGVAPAKDSVYLARGHTRSDNTALTLALVLQGVGIARLNDVVSEPLVRRGDLVPLLDDWFDRSRVPIYAAMLPERHRLPKVRACIDHWARWMRGEAAQAA